MHDQHTCLFKYVFYNGFIAEDKTSPLHIRLVKIDSATNSGKYISI